MFQEAALFPWLTARGNVELPLKIRKVPRAERHQKADELLDLVSLKAFGGKLPHELSGGMRQRVAMARALAQEADVLLMDEPFGALDAMTRDVLHDELERLWRETGLSVMFVTHNVREAVRLGDRVILLSSRPGRIVEEYPINIERPRRLDSFDVADSRADRSPTGSRTRCAAMAVDERALTAGLDALEVPDRARSCRWAGGLEGRLAQAARDRDRARRSGSS